jgi:hypothetical protein
MQPCRCAHVHARSHAVACLRTSASSPQALRCAAVAAASHICIFAALHSLDADPAAQCCGRAVRRESASGMLTSGCPAAALPSVLPPLPRIHFRMPASVLLPARFLALPGAGRLHDWSADVGTAAGKRSARSVRGRVTLLGALQARQQHHAGSSGGSLPPNPPTTLLRGVQLSPKSPPDAPARPPGPPAERASTLPGP